MLAIRPERCIWPFSMKPHQKRSELNGDCQEARKKRLRYERYNSECEGVSCKTLVHGCISTSGAGDPVKIDGFMNTEIHREIFINHAILSGKHPIVQLLIY